MTNLDMAIKAAEKAEERARVGANDSSRAWSQIAAARAEIAKAKAVAAQATLAAGDIAVRLSEKATATDEDRDNIIERFNEVVDELGKA